MEWGCCQRKSQGIVSQVGGSLGCSQHANLLVVFFGFEGVAEQGRGGRGVRKIQRSFVKSDIPFASKSGYWFSSRDCYKWEFLCRSSGPALLVFLISLNMITCTPRLHGQNHNELCQPRQPRVASVCVSKWLPPVPPALSPGYGFIDFPLIFLSG